MNMHVPERAERLAKWSLAPWERQAVLGDLQEEFLNIAETSGRREAHRWYWRHVLLSLWPNLIRRVRGDEHRAEQIRRTVPIIVQGLMFAGMAAFPTHRAERSDVYLGMGLTYVAMGLVGVGGALLRQRVRMPPDAGRTRLLKVAALTSLLLMLALMFTSVSRVPYVAVFLPVTCVLLLFIAEVVARRGSYPPPSEFFVRKIAASTESADLWLELDVPNAPLALSSLVLCHGPAAVAADGIHTSAPTIERSFQTADVLRLYSIVNAPAATASARLEVVTTSGDVRLQRPVAIARGQTEEVVKKWDDVADRDPAADFGEIDVKLALADLEPGRYRLRLTVDDGERTSMQQERIGVRA